MPTYDYRCRSCETTFEKRQRITEPAGAICIECGSDDCTRLISGGTFHLKGSGWYATDYGGATSQPSQSAGEGCAQADCSNDEPSASSADA